MLREQNQMAKRSHGIGNQMLERVDSLPVGPDCPASPRRFCRWEAVAGDETSHRNETGVTETTATCGAEPPQPGADGPTQAPCQPSDRRQPLTGEYHRPFAGLLQSRYCLSNGQ